MPAGGFFPLPARLERLRRDQIRMELPVRNSGGRYRHNRRLSRRGLGSIRSGSKAFQQSFSLEKSFIPSGVISIGAQAFSSCSSLSEVTLPQTLKSIGNKAFSNCKSLTSLVLPEGIEHIGNNNPFYQCDNLTDLSFSGPNKLYEIRDGALISKEESRLISWLNQTDAA